MSSSKPHLDDKPRRKADNAFRSVGDEGGLVVLPDRSQVKVLNPLGSRIYALLDGRHTQDEIVRIIVDEFEVGEEQARRDLRDYLRELDDAGMLAHDGEATAEEAP